MATFELLLSCRTNVTLLPTLTNNGIKTPTTTRDVPDNKPTTTGDVPDNKPTGTPDVPDNSPRTARDVRDKRYYLAGGQDEPPHAMRSKIETSPAPQSCPRPRPGRAGRAGRPERPGQSWTPGTMSRAKYGDPLEDLQPNARAALCGQVPPLLALGSSLHDPGNGGGEILERRQEVSARGKKTWQKGIVLESGPTSMDA